MIDDWVEGEIGAREYQLNEGSGAADLTGLTMSIELTAQDGTLISAPGAVVTVGDATSGKVRYTPAGTGILLESRSPISVRFKGVSGGVPKYFPKGLVDRFVVRKP